jgi:hypothetical protein
MGDGKESLCRGGVQRIRITSCGVVVVRGVGEFISRTNRKRFRAVLIVNQGKGFQLGVSVKDHSASTKAGITVFIINPDAQTDRPGGFDRIDKLSPLVFVAEIIRTMDIADNAAESVTLQSCGFSVEVWMLGEPAMNHLQWTVLRLR